MSQTYAQQVGIAELDMVDQFAGDVQVRVNSKCLIEVDGRNREFSAGVWSVTQKIADQMLAVGDPDRIELVE